MLFLDTDILSYFLANDAEVVQKITGRIEHGEETAITAITYYEIIKGFRYKSRPKKEARFNELLRKMKKYPLDDDAINIAAGVYGELRKTGKPHCDSDILIAAIVMRNGGTLYTNNITHFELIPNLSLLR